MIEDRLRNLEMEASTLLSEQYIEYETGMVFLCSFSREDMIILNLLKKNKIGIDIYTLDTGRLPQETYDLIQYVKESMEIQIRMVYPDQESLSKLISAHGPNLFYQSSEMRHACCNERKVKPMNLILEGRSAWVTGIRSEQTNLRARSKKLENTGSIVKINPLLDWTYNDVQEFTRSRGIEENKLYSKGYRSIGCLPCTRPVHVGEGERDGRWWWENESKECGIHLNTAGARNNGN